jgi:hypothetical protein
MQRLIERVWLDRRFTAIVVTDDVAEAVTLADRVLIIEARQITLDHHSIFSARADAARQRSQRWKGGFCASYFGMDRDGVTIRLDFQALVKLAWGDSAPRKLSAKAIH